MDILVEFYAAKKEIDGKMKTSPELKPSSSRKISGTAKAFHSEVAGLATGSIGIFPLNMGSSRKRSGIFSIATGS